MYGDDFGSFLISMIWILPLGSITNVPRSAATIRTASLSGAWQSTIRNASA